MGRGVHGVGVVAVLADAQEEVVGVGLHFGEAVEVEQRFDEGLVLGAGLQGGLVDGDHLR